MRQTRSILCLMPYSCLSRVHVELSNLIKILIRHMFKAPTKTSMTAIQFALHTNLKPAAGSATYTDFCSICNDALWSEESERRWVEEKHVFTLQKIPRRIPGYTSGPPNRARILRPAIRVTSSSDRPSPSGGAASKRAYSAVNDVRNGNVSSVLLSFQLSYIS
jgi:hypothetical protein